MIGGPDLPVEYVGLACYMSFLTAVVLKTVEVRSPISDVLSVAERLD